MSGKETRRKILETAYELIAEHGYNKMSISMICKELDIKKPSIYYYFESKEELFKKVVEEVLFDDEVERFNFNIDKDGYIDEFKRVEIDTIDSMLEDETNIKVLMEFYVQTKRIESLKPWIRQFDELFKHNVRKVIQLGVDLGVYRDDIDVNEFTEIVINAMQGLEYSIVFGFELDYKNIWNKTIDMLVKEGAYE